MGPERLFLKWSHPLFDWLTWGGMRLEHLF